MNDFTATEDYYEVLQVSKNADAETIQRVFRLLAQRFHPDNPESGNAERFRQIHDAYVVLSDAEKRAAYDVKHESIRQERWRFVMGGPPAENDFELEQHLRFVILEILYTRRRTESTSPGLSPFDLARLTGRPAEHLEFTLWYLTQKRMVGRSDQALLTITAEGVDYLESNPRARQERLRLTEASLARGA